MNTKENIVSTYLMTVNHKTNLKTYSIKPFNVNAYEFNKDSFSIYKKEIKDALRSGNGIYILFNFQKKIYYIGESEDVISRIKTHYKNKDWWDEVFLLVSDDFDINLRKVFEKWLIADSSILDIKNSFKQDNENKGISQKESNRLFDKNVNSNFEYVLNEFLKIIKPKIPFNDSTFVSELNEGVEFHLTSKDKQYKGNLIVTEGSKFKLLKGSLISLKTNPDWISTGWINEFDEIKMNCKKINDEVCELQSDLVKDKPTFLSSLVTGSSGNGWVLFKNKENRTLDEEFRKSPSFDTLMNRYEASAKLVEDFTSSIVKCFGDGIYVNTAVNYRSFGLTDNGKKIILYIRIYKDFIRIYTNEEKMSSYCGFRSLEKIHWGNSRWFYQIETSDDVKKITEKIIKFYKGEIN